MIKFSAYFRLARMDKPIGTLLLWYPTAWALWIANKGLPSLKLIILFLLGTFFMRSAGCIINDIADRHIDLHVARTKNRPLTSGEVNLTEAIVLLMLFLFGALLILIQLPYTCFYYAFFAIFITVLYPFCKRWIQAPQLILGIAFSMGIPMAYAASQGIYASSLWYLLAINVAWIIAYDTEYAMVDRRDDLLIGVKSTAVLFGRYDSFIIALLQFFLQLLWLCLSIELGFSSCFFITWTAASGILIYQHYLLSLREEKHYFQAFLLNNWYGLVMWVGIALSI